MLSLICKSNILNVKKKLINLTTYFTNTSYKLASKVVEVETIIITTIKTLQIVLYKIAKHLLYVVNIKLCKFTYKNNSKNY